MVSGRPSAQVARLGLALAVAYVACACAAPPSSPVSTPTWAPRVLSPEAAKVLAYLGRLSDDTDPGVIVGTACSSVGIICDDGQFQDAVGKLHDQSGKWPGLLVLDYESERVHTPAELSSVNRRVLVPYWQAGGLVMIDWDPANPWGPDQQNSWKDVDHKYPGADLHELLPGGVMRDCWRASLKRIADALAELRDKDMVVMWRPMQEMNNPVYWWAKTTPSDSHDVYAELWRDMFDYFVHERGLNNLLWVFAPTGTQTYSSYPYPGDAYVDIVAPTAYANDLAAPAYYDALAYGKPIAFSEYGPLSWVLGGEPMGADGTFDDRLYIQRLQRDYPRVAFFAVWPSWTGVKMSLADNLHARELMNDPGVITRDKIDWR